MKNTSVTVKGKRTAAAADTDTTRNALEKGTRDMVAIAVAVDTVMAEWGGAVCHMRVAAVHGTSREWADLVVWV